MDGQVGGDQVEGLVVWGAEDEGIPHPFLAHRTDEDRFGLIQGLPVPAVLADHEVDLLGHGGGLAPEGHEEIAAAGLGTDGTLDAEDKQGKQYSLHGRLNSLCLQMAYPFESGEFTSMASAQMSAILA